jgi:hypothetical protein
MHVGNKASYTIRMPNLEFLDPVFFEVTRLSGGFIDAACEERQERRFKRAWKEVDTVALGMASTAVGAWFMAQNQEFQDNTPAELLESLRSRIEAVGVGTSVQALSVIFNQSLKQLNLNHALTLDGRISVDGDGVGAFVIAGLYAFAKKPTQIFICSWCARTFTARAGTKVCSHSCRAAASKAALADQ